MAKKIEGYIKLQVPAGSATPSPPIGPALGQRGVNIMEFCKAFNAATQDLEKAMPIPTIITVYADRSFTFVTKTPPASFLIKKAANLKSGSKEPGKVSAGTIARSKLAEIAQTKFEFLIIVGVFAFIIFTLVFNSGHRDVFFSTFLGVAGLIVVAVNVSFGIWRAFRMISRIQRVGG